MDPVATATATAEVTGMLPAQFMLDAATYVRGAELGFDGVDFYIAGRGGALGEVSGQVVAASFVFFNIDHVVAGWERAATVMSRRDACLAFTECLERWALEHLPDDVDYERAAALAAAVVDATSPAGAPLFAAWAAVPEPSSDKGRFLKRLNVLRELRGGLHGAAVLASGLTPLQAVLVKTPYMAPIFGWPEPYPDVSACADAHAAADRATDAAVGRGFAALTESERDEFRGLVAAAHAGMSTGTGVLG